MSYLISKWLSVGSALYELHSAIFMISVFYRKRAFSVIHNNLCYNLLIFNLISCYFSKKYTTACASEDDFRIICVFFNIKKKKIPYNSIQLFGTKHKTLNLQPPYIRVCILWRCKSWTRLRSMALSLDSHWVPHVAYTHEAINSKKYNISFYTINKVVGQSIS